MDEITVDEETAAKSLRTQQILVDGISGRHVGKKTEQEESNNFKPAFSPRFQTGADTSTITAV
jgi:hypothetical protein